MATGKTKSTTGTVAVIIPNWNGADKLAPAIESILAQSFSDLVLVIVDNGSTDNSREVIESYCRQDNRIDVIWRDRNYGYTGGVNPGFEYAIDKNCTYAAPFNNDAIADISWLQNLVTFLESHDTYGIAACKMLHADGKTIDSTGEYFTSWGLTYPRGRGEQNGTQYDTQIDIFGASGGASLYRVNMLKEVGLLDDDFFAYYEDVDLSFRSQLAGWKVGYVPEAFIYHEQGGTTKHMISGFTTYQTMKNLPLVTFKNVPSPYLFRVTWRLTLARLLFLARAISRGNGWLAIKGDFMATVLLFKKRGERRVIQQSKKISNEQVWNLIMHDLPPNATALRRLRTKWRSVKGK